MEIRKVGVVGLGTMGAGIAQVSVQSGFETIGREVEPELGERGRATIERYLARGVEKGRLSGDERDAALGRLTLTTDLADLADCDLVIEAALEELELKREIFAELDRVTRPDAILATNTSALSVSEIAEATARPGRVIGLHFFNPAPVMALVEVVAPPLADPAVVARAVAIMTTWGKTPVVCADRPGFIVNRVNRPFTIEALRILENGVGTITGIDEAMRDGGFPMGPFELMDLTGIDVTFAAATGIWERLGHPDRLRPSPIQEAKVEAGDLGRKTGRGFYEYADGQRLGEAEQPADTPPEEHLSPARIRGLILDAIATEARFAADEGVATPDVIDLALRLGAGHPHGPFESRRPPS